MPVTVTAHAWPPRQPSCVKTHTTNHFGLHYPASDAVTAKVSLSLSLSLSLARALSLPRPESRPGEREDLLKVGAIFQMLIVEELENEFYGAPYCMLQHS